MLVIKFHADIVMKIVLGMAAFQANNGTGAVAVKELSLKLILTMPVNMVPANGLRT
jgi:hypothetical protein